MPTPATLTMTTPSTILEFSTYDSGEATSTGYDITFRNDGTAKLVKHTNWAGEVAGTTWIADVPISVKAAVKREIDGIDHGDNPDLAAAVESWLCYADEQEWRKIRIGSRNP